MVYKSNLKPTPRHQLIRKSRRPTPLTLGKSQAEDQTPLINPIRQPRHNWQRFTLEAAQDSPKLANRLQLVDRALRCTKLKAEGAIAWLGVPGWVEELGIAGEHVGTYINRFVDAYDDFEDLSGSILGARAEPRTHRLTPPTVHGRVRLHSEWPDLSDEARRLLLVCIARDYWEPLKDVRAELFEEATLIGHHDVLRDIARAQKLKYLVIAHFMDWVAVRASR